MTSTEKGGKEDIELFRKNTVVSLCCSDTVWMSNRKAVDAHLNDYCV